MNCLNVVASHEVCHYLAKEITCLLQMRSKIPLCTILQEPLWVLVIDVIRSNIFDFATTTCHTVWVNPYVYINTALVRFSTNKLQWVVSRRLSLFACKPSTPWFQLGFVQRIRSRTNLKYDSIEVHCLKLIQHSNQIGFLLLIVANSSLGREVDISYGAHPCSTKIRLCCKHHACTSHQKRC